MNIRRKYIEKISGLGDISIDIDEDYDQYARPGQHTDRINITPQTLDKLSLCIDICYCDDNADNYNVDLIVGNLRDVYLRLLKDGYIIPLKKSSVCLAYYATFEKNVDIEYIDRVFDCLLNKIVRIELILFFNTIIGTKLIIDTNLVKQGPKGFSEKNVLYRIFPQLFKKIVLEYKPILF